MKIPAATMRPLRLAGLGAALLASGAAWGGDMAPTPEGASALTAFLSGLLGAPVGGADSSVSVKSEASGYAVTVDVGAMLKGAQALGVTYSGTPLTYHLVQQTDGLWRVTANGPFEINATMKEGTTKVRGEGLEYRSTFDPATQWMRDAAFQIGAQTINVALPGVTEAITVASIKGDGTATAADDGAMTTEVNEAFGAITIKVAAAPKGQTAPMAFSARAQGGNVKVALQGILPATALGLWRLVAANPQRAQMAAHEAELKALLTELASRAVGLNENFAFDKMTVNAGPGDSSVEKFGGAVEIRASGPDSVFGESVRAEGLKLVKGLVPPAFADLVPTAFSIGFMASGADVAAAAREAIADLHLAGEGPPFADADREKIGAMFLGGGALTVDIPASHVSAPKLDVGFEGQFRYVAGRPQGKLTVKARNFDATIAAVTAVPGIDPSASAVLAMAKGLGHDERDATLGWDLVVAPDGAFSVNGTVLGKIPVK